MKKSIVIKWFSVILLLFFSMFLLIVVSHNYFFEKFYINNKSTSLRECIESFSNVSGKRETLSWELYKNNSVWITELDAYGRIRYANDYFIEVVVSDGAESLLTIPLYPYEGNFSDIQSLFKIGDDIVLDALNIDGEIIPYQIQTSQAGVINFSIANRLHGPSADKSYNHLTTGMYKGKVTKTMLPERNNDIPFPYSERFFIDRIKLFQSDLLSNKSVNPMYENEFTSTENLVDYKVIVTPFAENGYIFAMTSLQPVDEAILVMRQFYPYFLSFAFLSAVFLAFIISQKLSKPIVTINRITGKIAGMDFDEKLPVNTTDEIGQLSRNINYLSEQMELHIGRLKQDLDKERQLEKTRKEFISGVSHELKTPLAVMKSCLSILQDGIAAEKKDHYFHAMEKEIQRMDTLIVNMLELAKYESGTYKPEFSTFEIDQLTTEVCQSLLAHIQEKNITLKTSFCTLTVVGHRVLISRVIANFLSNAISHTDYGNSITITITDNGNLAKISVENQGLPLSDEDLKNIWQQFYRSKSKRPKIGTGLGLSISKSILELHNSAYGVENSIDGVIFYFTLPISE